MRLDEVRTAYFDFFKEREHKIIPSASLVPENDPTTLFTGSGMQPLLPYLLGEAHPEGKRLADSQKSFRAEDIEEVGDNRHTTFFEMLGNWSLGDYFKDEQLSWFFEFLTDKIGLDPQKLYVTVFSGDEKSGVPKDTESAEIWKKLFADKGVTADETDIGSEEEGYRHGMKEGERIFYYDAKKNWWSRAGVPENMPAGEPGGPDSEVFYDFGMPHDESFGEQCHPNCDCGRFMEIGNSVFMQYIKKEDGSFEELPQRNVDFGGGLERIAAASNNNPDVFTVDALSTIIKKLEELSKQSYTDTDYQNIFRIIADHIRGAVFMIGDGVTPSNTEQGYFVRRLIRRSVRHMDVLGGTENNLHTLVASVVESYKDSYPELIERQGIIETEIREEELRFRQTLMRGLREFDRISNDYISGKEAFVLFTTYGFPIEMTVELANEKGKEVDVEGFKSEMKQHQDLSRAGAEQKFKGGLQDHSEMSVKYHTATHLLHRALKDVLGEEVEQRGSNITPERLRFDFSFPRKMTDEEKRQVEDIVNEKIAAKLPVSYEDIPLPEAEKRGAIGLFEEKYGDKVRVYQIGDPDVGSGHVYSLEFCGGPHVENTSELGHFTIAKEEASAAGIRRIKATLTN